MGTEGENTLTTKALRNGRLEISLVQDGVERGKFSIRPSRASSIAGQLLTMAREIHEASGVDLPDRTKQPSAWPIIQVSSIGLGPCPLPDHLCLVVTAGEAMLGIAVERSIARSLGASLMAASAEAAKPH